MRLSAKVTSLFLLITSIINPAFPAPLILDEQFNGTTSSYYQARGWYDGTSEIATATGADGYKFETDPVLGRNVMYAHWATLTSSTSGDPKAPADGWRYPFTADQAANGITIYILAKFHNVMGSPWGGHWIRCGRGFTTYTPGNSDGQMDLDIAGISQLDRDINPTTNLLVNPVQRTPHFYAGTDSTGRDIGWAGAINTWTDDQWYEIGCYMLPGNAGALNCVIRKYGTTAWTTAFKGSKILTSLGSGNITQFLIGPYMDRWTSDIRHYYATIRLYSGDAISDSSIGSIKSGIVPNKSIFQKKDLPQGPIHIYNIQGRHLGVYSFLLNEKNFAKTRPSLPNGAYLMEANAGANEVLRFSLSAKAIPH